jgi:hypothetical protein
VRAAATAKFIVGARSHRASPHCRWSATPHGRRRPARPGGGHLATRPPPRPARHGPPCGIPRLTSRRSHTCRASSRPGVRRACAHRWSTAREAVTGLDAGQCRSAVSGCGTPPPDGWCRKRVRCQRVMGPEVHPGVPGPDGQECLDHPRAETGGHQVRAVAGLPLQNDPRQAAETVLLEPLPLDDERQVEDEVWPAFTARAPVDHSPWFGNRRSSSMTWQPGAPRQADGERRVPGGSVSETLLHLSRPAV